MGEARHSHTALSPDTASTRRHCDCCLARRRLNDLLPVGRTIASIGLLSPRGKVLETHAPILFPRLAEGRSTNDDCGVALLSSRIFVEAARVN